MWTKVLVSILTNINDIYSLDEHVKKTGKSCSAPRMLDQKSNIRGAFLMAKYSKEFKLHVINEYLHGYMGTLALAKKYQIASPSQIQIWVRKYKQTGIKGLQSKERQEYTGEFKLNVLNYMKTTGASYSQTAIHFGLSDLGTIANWNATFLKDGVEALFKLKGRPRTTMTKQKTTKSPKTLTREQQLEEELNLLKLEVAYLKKCHAHGITPWNLKANSKPKSSKN